MKISTLLAITFLMCPSIVAMTKQLEQKCQSSNLHLNNAVNALKTNNFGVAIANISLAQQDMERLPQDCRTNAQSKCDFINGCLLQEAMKHEAAKGYFNQVLKNTSAPEDIRKQTLFRLAQIQIQH